jgi:hypothetical protein
MLYGPGTGEYGEEARPENIEYSSCGRDLSLEAEGCCILRHYIWALMIFVIGIILREMRWVWR